MKSETIPILRSAIIAADRGTSDRLVGALESVGGFTITDRIQEHPPLGDLVRTLRASRTDTLFLSFDDLQAACAIAKALEVSLPEIELVAICAATSSRLLREAMRLGIREPLSEPFDSPGLLALRSRLEQRRSIVATSRNGGHLISFLPSKPGVGTSTIAINLSAALGISQGEPALLADFDLSSGMIRFLLRAENKSSVVDAIELAPQLDDELWSQLVTKRRGIDILHSGEVNPEFFCEATRLSDFLNFLRRRYSLICADLSGNLERYSLALLEESAKIFLVCTPEVSSLHLAREKLDFLRQLKVESKVSIVLNRIPTKCTFTTAQIVDFLETPVAHAFRNDYPGVGKAIVDGTVVDPASPLGREFAEFAARLHSPLASASAVYTTNGAKAHSLGSSLRSLQPAGLAIP